MSLPNITLVSFGRFENDFLDKLVEGVSNEFQMQARAREGFIDLSDFYDPVRRQYNGNDL